MKHKLINYLMMMLVGSLLMTTNGQAQNTGFYGTQKNVKVERQFSAVKLKSAKEIESLIMKILKKVGVRKRHFKVIEMKGSGFCLAKMTGDIKKNNRQPAILYDPLFLEQFRSGFDFTNGRISDKQKMDWIALSILAHEVGHIINQHLANDMLQDESKQPLELEADEFSGFVLCRLGATLKQAQAAMYSELVPAHAEEWESHPARADRLAAIKRGFEEAECSTDLVPEGMIFVEGGSFIMGCLEGDNDCQDDEKPRHEVILDDFYIGKYEVTNAEYCEFLNAKGKHKDGDKTWLAIESSYCKIEYKNGRYTPKSAYGKHPVVVVTWYGADAYAKWKGMRLPTEAEWEYAARSRGKNEKWAGTSSEGRLDSYGNFCDKNCSYSWKKENANDGYERTAPVGSFQPNDLGVYDMSGNVWEWCSDWYDKEYYKTSPKINPQNTYKNKFRSLRGGSWDDLPRNCRTSYRYNFSPSNTVIIAGFRLAQ